MWAVLGFLIAAAIGLAVVLAARDRGSVQCELSRELHDDGR